MLAITMHASSYEARDPIQVDKKEFDKQAAALRETNVVYKNVDTLSGMNC